MKQIEQIWMSIFPEIDWIVFVMVLAIGYLVRGALKKDPRFLKFLDKYGTTVKILVVNVVIISIYAFAEKLSYAIVIRSLVIAFGFHTVLIKVFERVIFPKKIEQ